MTATRQIQLQLFWPPASTPVAAGFVGIAFRCLRALASLAGPVAFSFGPHGREVFLKPRVRRDLQHIQSSANYPSFLAGVR